MNTHFTEEIADYHNLLNIRKNYGYIMVIELENDVNLPGLESRIRNSIKYKCRAVVGPLMGKRIIISVHEDENINSNSQKEKAIKLAESIQVNLSNIINSKINIGIGNCYKINDFNCSYQEAIKSLRITKGSKVVHIKDTLENIKLKHTNNYIEIKSDEDSIMKNIKEGKIYEVEMKMKNFFNKICKLYGNDEEAIKNTITELMILIRMAAFREGVFSEENNQLTYINDLKNIKEHHNLKNWCILEAKRITEAIKSQKEDNTSDLISEAKEFIKENYNEELHLKDVAMAISISPQYLSKIFKDEVGINFIDYLTTVRIEEAKKMLKQENLSIKEICFTIGYNDPNYFSRLFKKIVGVSPTEYI
jgi:two-component system response regulator YesN